LSPFISARRLHAGDFLAAAITSVVAIAYGLSYGALLFSGPLSAYVGYGISSMLITSAVSGLVVAALSSFDFAIAGADSNATGVLAAITATIAQRLLEPRLAVHTILATLISSALAGGIVLYLLGHFRMGHWIRFIPYPIVAGFLAATGWLLVSGALRVIADLTISARAASALTPAISARLATGLTVAALLFATRRIKNPLLMPLILVSSGIVIDAVLLLIYRSLSAAGAQGWLLPALTRPDFAPAWEAATFTFVQWQLVLALLPAIATAIAVITIAILFGAAGLEAQTGADADLDRELRSSGIASIASGLCGGSLGVLSSSRSLVNVQAGAKTRFSGLIVAVVSFLALIGGSAAISVLPRPLLGGLLLFLGFSLLYDWLILAWTRVSRVDVVLITTIVLITAFSGFIEALVVGLIFACVNFAIRYGQHRVIKHSLSGAVKRSRVERSAAERALLDEHGEHIRILTLQGYVFFGTANTVLEEARAYVNALGDRWVRYLILNLEAVTGFDTSAAQSFAKIAQLAVRSQTTILYCGVYDAALASLRRAGGLSALGSRHNTFYDLDHALEWCEDRLLADFSPETESIEAWLARELGGDAMSERLLAACDEVRLNSGEYLFREGDVSDALFLVAVGRLRVAIEGDGGERRLRSMVAGSFVGEIGLYSQEPRSASVIAEQDALIYRLSASALERLTTTDSALVAAFHALLFRLSAERLRFASAEIAALQA
jgi:sulfate permease, SulP family